MKKAIVTGASSGIGKEISKALCADGFFVFGFGRKFNNEISENFLKTECDFLNIANMAEVIKKISSENEINVLVNCAGAAYYGLHEELNAKKIHEMVTVNIEAPLIITQLLLRNLKKTQGHIINISSVTSKKSNPRGAAYGATKAALSSFSQSIFDEARKYGVKVSAVCPDMANTNLYRNADFEADKSPDCSIAPEEIAEAVLDIINSRINISEIILQPQKHRISKK